MNIVYFFDLRFFFFVQRVFDLFSTFSFPQIPSQQKEKKEIYTDYRHVEGQTERERERSNQHDENISIPPLDGQKERRG